MKKIYLLLFAVFLNSFTYAQHQADNWYFGIHAGLNFSSGVPVALTDGALSTTEGCSSISDAQGNILFYTNGVSVWDKNNQIMPNGNGLDGDISTSQSALIVPLPASNNMIYYVFTLGDTGGTDGFRYSIVDMSQNGGLGDVITKNVFVIDQMTERMAAESQSNGMDYWIVIHEWGSNAFYSYSLTAGGLQLNPVISNTGIVHSTAQIQNTYGQMKFSTCNDRLAVAAGYLDTVQVFHFDNATGVVSDPITLPMANHVYGVEFSPDGSILYVSCYDEYGTLLQFDLSSNDQATIMASKKILSLTVDTYALQLGPDGKIYVCNSFSPYLGVINAPNVAGYNCNWDDNSVTLDPNYMGITSALGLPEFVQSVFKVKGSCLATSVEEGEDLQGNSLYPNPSSENFTISLPGNSTSDIIIYSTEGKVMEQLNDIRGEKFSFGTNLNPGIYLVMIKNNSGVSMHRAIKL